MTADPDAGTGLLVVDASVVVHLLAVERPDGPVHRRLTAEADVHAPHLLDLEVVSSVRRFAAAGRLSDRDADRCLVDLADLPVVRYAHGALLRRVLALRHNLTVYDAVYVALAEALGATLLTADRPLAGAPGPRCPVELVP